MNEPNTPPTPQETRQVEFAGTGILVETPAGYYALVMARDAACKPDEALVANSNGTSSYHKISDLKILSLGPLLKTGAPASFIEIIRQREVAEALVSGAAELATAERGIAVLQRQKIDPQVLHDAENRVIAKRVRFKNLLSGLFTQEALLKLSEVARSSADRMASDGGMNVVEIGEDNQVVSRSAATPLKQFLASIANISGQDEVDRELTLRTSMRKHLVESFSTDELKVLQDEISEMFREATAKTD